MPRPHTMPSSSWTRTSSWRPGSSRCTSSRNWRTKRSLIFKGDRLTTRREWFSFSNRAETTIFFRRCTSRVDQDRLILRALWCHSAPALLSIALVLELPMDSLLKDSVVVSIINESTSQSKAVDEARLLLIGLVKAWISANSWRSNRVRRCRSTDLRSNKKTPSTPATGSDMCSTSHLGRRCPSSSWT